MSRRVVLVIMDGVGFSTAISQCGYLEGAVKLGQARRWRMVTVSPSISGPMYETIHTGLWPHQHGIGCNHALRRSIKPSVFSLARAAGKRTAAVAHSYFYTLYVDKPWDPLRSIEHRDDATDIQAARFYTMEAYSKSNAVAPAEIDLCAQTVLLMEQCWPDYLLLHTCSADTLGHTFGGDSPEYRQQTRHIDEALSRVIPWWLSAGYDVMVTADHGMTADGHHGGVEPEVLQVPFYFFGDAEGLPAGQDLDQLGIAASILNLLGVAPAPDMGKPFLRVTS